MYSTHTPAGLPAKTARLVTMEPIAWCVEICGNVQLAPQAYIDRDLKEQICEHVVAMASFLNQYRFKSEMGEVLVPEFPGYETMTPKLKYAEYWNSLLASSEAMWEQHPVIWLLFMRELAKVSRSLVPNH